MEQSLMSFRTELVQQAVSGEDPEQQEDDLLAQLMAGYSLANCPRALGEVERGVRAAGPARAASRSPSPPCDPPSLVYCLRGIISTEVVGCRGARSSTEDDLLRWQCQGFICKTY